MEIALEILPETLHRFMAGHAALANWLGHSPRLEWLMAFALDSSEPDAVVQTLRQMGSDYLRNRRSSE